MGKDKDKPTQLYPLAPAPHVGSAVTTQRMMIDVIVALLPLLAMAVILFRGQAIGLVVTCIVCCLATEEIFNRCRRKPSSLRDGSAVVTGLILAFSLPASLPLWAAAMGSVGAIAIGKMVFGGLGQNIFNPAMVGRAFLMICFATLMSGPAGDGKGAVWPEPQIDSLAHIEAVTRATPLAAGKLGPTDKAKAEAAGELNVYEKAVDIRRGKPEVLWDLFMGRVAGCIGETSALAILVGGIWLIVRGTIWWGVPVAMLATIAAIGGVTNMIDPERFMSPATHLLGGGAMFGAFFIATDLVTTPLSKTGRLIFAIGTGAIVMMIRLAGNYPEGVMFAILVMNSLSPLIDRLTKARPTGLEPRMNTNKHE